MDNPELRSVDLIEGEKVLWSGKPVVAMVAGPNQAYAKIFGLFFAGFAVFWMIGAAGMIGGTSNAAQASPGRYVFALFGLPFLAAGIYVAFGSNFVAAQRLKNTFYVLTDRRAIVVTGGNLRSVKAYDLSSMNGAEKQTRADGCGAIVFQLKDAGALMSMYSYRSSSPMMNMTPPGFYGIKDVDSVYRLFEATRTSPS